MEFPLKGWEEMVFLELWTLDGLSSKVCVNEGKLSVNYFFEIIKLLKTFSNSEPCSNLFPSKFYTPYKAI